MKRVEAKHNNIGFLLVRGAGRIADMAVLMFFLAAFVFGCYTMWDSNQIFEEAYASNYKAYKPEAKKDTLSYDELLERNPDVAGWLCIYGTGIDYPVVQAPDNNTYLNHNILGEVSLAGSIFMDYRNQRNFEDFNTIIYGHHMEKSAMFGDISKFSDKEYFDLHRYGDIYYEGEHHGLEFLAVLQSSAYNGDIYNPAVSGDEERQQYLALLYSYSVHTREVKAVPADRLVLLSTCKTEPSDGRWILLGRITDEVFEDTFDNTGKAENLQVDWLRSAFGIMPLWGYCILGIFILILVIWFFQRRQ